MRPNKVVRFSVPHTERELVRVQIDELPHFYDLVHQHSEIQVMYIIKGEGTLLAGDFIGRFHEGQVYVLGSHQPHVFRCDKKYYNLKNKTTVKSISLYFDETYGGDDLWNTNEWMEIKKFKQEASRGFAYTPEISKRAGEIIIQLASATGLNRLILFAQLLSVLSKSERKKILSLQSHSLPQNEEERLNRIFAYTFRHFHRKVTLTEVADLAHLTIEAFCRYFKLHTRKTFIGFLQEVRISNACRMLQQSGMSVEQISEASGFNNLTHFNRTFKRLIKKTPRQYRKLF